ncbi:Mu transposase C-terminal domain-containing protein [Pontibacterium granulatum]|uniref:Mu transposase C-terminal domain-containing protein n=1 Tax=Pontibacterium granulatum TaxID=2036029 RepID=UPI00249A47B1|nr:Mu transposase C-terminal domain-containing protein [Pontibacterium granulatum]MDI3325605.1 Mu transposase C-terminal domain-containing protein [Pontibacterium granulatum]
MKEWYTTRELADAQLTGMPATVAGIIKLAKRESWEAQQRMGKGGGYEYHISNLPRPARKELEARQAEAMLPRLLEQNAVTIKSSANTQANLTERQRTVADARVTVINAVEGLKQSGITQEAALTTLLTQAVTGQLKEINPVLDAALRLAKDPRGRSNSLYPSNRSLKRWLGTDTKALAPKAKRPLKVPTWANDFLMCWQRPEKPSVEHAYRQLTNQYDLEGKTAELPSIHQVRRFITKMGNIAKQKGRMGARELKNMLPFVRRDFSDLLPADIYSADGHTFDGEVQHPLHGRPFRPEVTTFIDIATRRVVGVSVDLAESSIAVLDALISACTHAVPALIYVDNGGGYENALLKDQATGVLARLGSTMTHSLPYSSQARGVIERVHQTLWVDGAKELPGFIGADMDQEARQIQFKLSRQAIKHGGTLPLLGWQTFMDYVNQRIQWYNQRPHSSLPKTTDIQGKRRHLAPDELWQQHQNKGWTPTLLTADEAVQVFRPRTTRKVSRGEIKFINNIYFSHALTEWHGEEVHVAYDINDPTYIWVYETEHGRQICKAEWNANRVDYMPKSVIENAREGRAKARLRRNDAHREEILEELNGRPALEQEQTTYIPGIGALTPDLLSNRMGIQPEEITVVEETGPRTPASMTADERITLYLAYQSGTPVPEEHRFWFSRDGETKEYSAWARREQEMGSEARTL